MTLIILVAIVILTVSTLAGIRTFLNRSIQFPIKTKALPIDDHFAQEIVNGISSGLVPRIVLAKICGEYFLEKTRIACLSGTSITNAVVVDLPNDLIAKSFASLWQVCENNGAALSPALSQFAQQIRVAKELRQELFSSMSGAKLSAWVLAGLPLFGIVLAGFLGVNSLEWLANSKIGNFNIVAALILEVIGIIWVRKITSRIESLL
jgi:tight adherence protein B